MPEPLTAEPAADLAATPSEIPSSPFAALLLRRGLSRDRLVQWTKILSAYFSAQGAVRLLGIVAGLLLINFMAVEEYALYTLAFSVVTFFHLLTDLGSTSSLVYFFHKATTEGEEFAPYAAAVESLRKLAFLLGGIGVLAAFPLTAGAKGFALPEVLLVTAGIVLVVWFQIDGAIRVLCLRLADRYGLSYRAEVAGGAVRLGLVALLVALAFLPAWLAVLTAAAGAAILARIARPGRARSPSGQDLRPYRRQVLRYLVPTLPSALYFSIQGPLVVWLAATFGGTRNIAEVGALGRLGMTISLFSGLASIVFLPRMAHITDERLYRRRYFQYGGSLAAVALALLAAAWLMPNLFLFLLGANYAGLDRELLLVVIGAGLTLVGGYAVGVNQARSWNRWQGAAVGLLVVAQALFVAVLDLSDTAGVLTFGMLSAAVGLGLQLAITWLGFVRPQWVRWA
jgi:O-antigen/teichoic acid export membrane protein